VRIAIVKLSAMGDIVHAMTALQFVKRALPDSHIDWVVEESFTGVLENNLHIDRILPVNLKALKKNKSQLWTEIKRIRFYAENEYDIVIDAQGLIKSAIVSRILGSSRGFDGNSTREKPASWFYKKSFSIPYEENVIYRNVKLISDALEIEFDRKVLGDKKPFLFFTERERRKTIPYVTKNHKNIIYIVGSSWESKIYPMEKLLEVVRRLGENALMVWGDGKEYKFARHISQNSKAILLPRLTLGELKAVISKADLVIGGDSGPTHFAWAMNRPSITLFGPTPGKRNTLEGDYTRVICSPSEVDPLHLDRKDQSIGEIDSEEIIRVAKELLNIRVMMWQKRE